MLFGSKKPVIEKAAPIDLVSSKDRYELDKTLSDIFKKAHSEVKLLSARMDNRDFAQPASMTEANLFLCTPGASMKIIMSAEEHSKYLRHPLLELQKKHADRAELRLMDEDIAPQCSYEFMLADRKDYFYRQNFNSIGHRSSEASIIEHLNNSFDRAWELSYVPA